MTSFYNTTSMIGPNLLSANNQAERQDDIVFEFFKRKKTPHSPSQVHRILILNKSISISTPLTSIRRSIHTLTKNLRLQKTDIMVDGPYGRKEHTWMLV